MMRQSKGRLLLVSQVIALLLLPIYSLQAERVYEIFDLGTLDGSSQASAISENGLVTGSFYYGFQGSEREAFRWQRDGVTPLNGLPQRTSSDAIEDGIMTGLGRDGTAGTNGRYIDDSGIIVGSNTEVIGPEPIRIDGPNSITNYNSIAPNGESWRLGDAVGYDNATGRIAFENGYTYLPGDPSASFIGSLSGSVGIGPTEVFASHGETIVGASSSGFGPDHAVLWRPDIGLTNLHPSIEARLGPLYNSYAVDITSQGYIVGMSEVEPPDFGGPSPTVNVQAAGDFEIGPGPDPGDLPEGTGIIGWVVVPAPGGIGPPNVIELGPISRIEGQGILEDRGVNAVNNYGHVVGTSEFFDEEIFAPIESPYLYRDNRQVPIADLLPNDRDWSVQYVSDINDRGEIVGRGISPDGNARGFLMRLAAPQQFAQVDNTWSSDALIGDTRWTMGEAGCFVTSTSMVLSTFGHNINPQQLNNYLDTNTNFANGDVNFAQMPRTTTWGQQDVDQGLEVEFNFANIAGNNRAEIVGELEKLIERHGPVILRVPYYSATNQGFSFDNGVHAIVAYRVEEDGTVWVRNPGSTHSGTGEFGVDVLTLDGYIEYENNRRANLITPLSGDLAWLTERNVTYASVVSDENSIRAVTESDIDFVITDPEGRRLGFDPTANGGLGVFYDEIPDAFYDRNDQIISPDDQLITEGIRSLNLIIQSLLDGDYFIDIFSNTTGDWSLNLGESSEQGFNPSQSIYSGSASSAGAVGSFTFTVTTIPEPHSVCLILAGVGLLLFRRDRES